ncbi:MAG: hypothetical protein IJT44_09110 [Clostridia bacterium]|nr:hypothetical protein [Clostridia bacterium]
MRDLLRLLFENYQTFLYLAIAAVPAVLYRARRLPKDQLTAVQRTGWFLLVAAAALGWGNVLPLAARYWHVPRIAQAAAFCLASALFGLALGPVCAFILRTVRKAGESKFFTDKALFFALTAIWGVQLALHLPDTLAGWHTCSYAVSYSMGFSSRFLLGSVMRLLFGDFVSRKEIFWFCFAVYTVFILLCSALLNRLYRKTPQENKPAVLFAIACFAACPGSAAALWNSGNYGKLEVYGLILSLLGVIAFRCIRSVPLRYLCITVCACVSIAIYQGYVFLYFTVLAVAMIEDLTNGSAHGSLRARGACAALTCLASAVCFFCFQFISTISFGSAEEMLAALQKHTDAEMDVKAIRFEYFLPLRDSYALVTNRLQAEFGRQKLFIELLLISPMIFLIAYVCLRYNRDGRGLRARCGAFNFSLLTVLFVLPQFVMNVDWGRWMTAVTINFAFIFAYRLYCGDKKLSEMAADLSVRLRENPLPAVMVILFLNALRKFAVVDPSSDVGGVVQLVNHLIK